MRVMYTAVSRFDAACGQRWQEFVKWSGLMQLREVVSLDCILCPPLVRELTAEDWEHNVHQDHKVDFFWDLEYLGAKMAGADCVNILALMQNPTAADVGSFVDPRFQFRGFDLVEEDTGISALVNCGGFERAFAGADLSDCGLLIDLGKAQHVQERLRAEYPDEDHANCDLWAIWQMVSR